MNADKINENVESRLTIHSIVEAQMNAGEVKTKKSDQSASLLRGFPEDQRACFGREPRTACGRQLLWIGAG